MNLFFWYYAVFAYILIVCKSHDDFNIDKYLTTIDDDLKEWTKSALNDNYNTKTNETKTNNNCLKNLNSCPPSKFSEISGRCNNVFNVNWGRRGAPFSNWLHTSYINEINQPDVSNIVRILKENKISENKLLVTTLMVSWIDFVLEDIGKVVKVESGIENCCNRMYYQFRNECQPIIDDNHCLPYTRSLPSNLMCNLPFGRRNQMNSVSGFLDASPLYGHNNHEMLQKRSFISGLLKDFDINDCKSMKFLYGKCNPLVLIFLKEHNRIARDLSKVNEHWSDDEIFWEARRIVIAEIQHITYNEFLFNLLGEMNMKSDEQLVVKNYGFYKKYSSSKKIKIYNEIVTGVLPALLSMYPNEKLKFEINEESYEKSVLTSFLQTLALMPNINFTGNFKTLVDYDGLNKEPEYVIHQSRDHGLSPYVSYANMCSKSNQQTEVFKFQDLKRFGIPKNKIDVLQSIYRNVNDIDLIIGGIFEEPLPGSIVGPTFACLLKKQFILLRQSDRFWYENDLPPSSFSLEQIQEIKKIRLSSVLCANFPHFESLPSNIFVTEDDYLNSQLNCNYYQLPELNKWIEIDSKTEELTKDLVRDAIFKAENLMLNRHKMEYNAWKKRFGVDPKSPSGTAAAFSKANKYAVRLANISHLYEYASKELINSLEQRRRRRKRQTLDNFADSSRSFLNEDYVDSLQSIDMGSFLSDDFLNQDSLDECNDVGPCDSTYEYRTYTGHCNNLKYPLWGKSLTPFTRLLEPRYDDAVSAPKTRSISHRKLPSPRKISVICHADISDISNRNTLMLMQFAQFLDHDLTMTPIHQGFHESVPDCRNCASARFVHPECNPIPIPEGDPFYPVKNHTTNEPMCLPFMRSLPGQNQLGYREQLNQNTAFLDGSQIYGENQCISHKLKGSDGKMNSTVHFSAGKELLPRTSEHPECRAGSGFCFMAGDGRASEQAGLTMIHTIFMREHNRILDELKQINPHWDGEKLFQVVRKIVIAELQHITYNEFLPRILGWETMNRYGLELQKEGFYKGYNDSCNPSVSNEFAAAAYRIGHSMLRPYIPRLNSSYDYVGYLLLRDTFFNPDIMMEREMVDEIARGMVSTPMEKLDKFVTGEVTNHLFEDKKIPFSGVDLVALNIQRGRDHGLPGYTEYRKLCKLPNADSFVHLLNEMPPESVRDFQRIYESVHDIDLFPGGLSETPLKGGLAGPTFSCIMGLQFRELRRCDRFWYENDDPVVGFKANQLAEIRKISLAKVICANFDRTSRMQRSAFDVPDNFLNPRLDCDNLPTMNMSVWKDYSNEGCFIGGQQIPVGHSAFPSPCTSCICTIAGAQCASLRVTNCDQLMKEWTIESILKDDICATQCAYHLARAQQKQRSPRIPSQFQTNFLRPPPPPSPPKSSLTGSRTLRDPSLKRPVPHPWRQFSHSASLNANANLNHNNNAAAAAAAATANLNHNRPFQDFSDFAPILNPIL